MLRTSLSWSCLSKRSSSTTTCAQKGICLNNQIRSGPRQYCLNYSLPSSQTWTSTHVPLCYMYKRGMSGFPPPHEEPPFSLEGNEVAGDDLMDNMGRGDSISFSIIDKEVDIDLDENLSHLRTKLYPLDSDPLGPICRINEAVSVQEVFDIISTLPNTSPKVASQALVSIWDLQKLLFQLQPNFTPDEDIFNKANFVNNIKENSVFQEKIITPILDMHQDLEDEPLCACLLAMTKMNYNLAETEPLIYECIRRKESLCLSGLSRLSVCLKTHGIYGQFIMAEFTPIVLKYITSMSDDLSVRMVSILLRNASRVISDDIFKAYVTQLSHILDSDIINNFETVTYCKMFLVLLHYGKLSPMPLIHLVGYRLRDRTMDMELMELISLQRFLVGPVQEPWSLVEALIAKSSRVIEETQERPRIDLISSVGIFMRGSQQKKKLAQITSECIEQNDFATVQNVLFPLVKCIRVRDREVYDKYWNNSVKFVEDGPIESGKVFSIAKNYLNFCHSLSLSYRNSWLEVVCKKIILSVLDRYCTNLPTILINPSDFAVIFSFLIAFDSQASYLDLKYISKFEEFVGNIRAGDLAFIVKGLDCALFGLHGNKKTLGRKNYEIISEICSILEQESFKRVLKSDASQIESGDLSMVWRVLSVIRKMKGDSPLLEVGIKAFNSMAGSHNSKEIREVCSALVSGNYYYPETMGVITDYIFKNLRHLNPDTIERYLNLTYSIGWDNNEHSDFGKLADVIELNWERLGLGIIQCGISLGFHHQFRPELIDKIFNVDFLDHIDEELRNAFGRNQQYPFRLRMNLMELNRIVCLDIPNVRLPWFHEKFCQNVLSQGRSNPSYLHDEVETVLTDLIGKGAVQTNVCLPQDYYYNIDFVIKFDSKDRPIRSTPSRPFSFSRHPKENPSDVKRKVAILVFHNPVFTKNVRQLKGGYKLKQRHLEILGYHVICIDSHKWNSMAFSELAVKFHYLENQIFNYNKS